MLYLLKFYLIQKITKKFEILNERALSFPFEYKDIWCNELQIPSLHCMFYLRIVSFSGALNRKRNSWRQYLLMEFLVALAFPLPATPQLSFFLHSLSSPLFLLFIYFLFHLFIFYAYVNILRTAFYFISLCL